MSEPARIGLDNPAFSGRLRPARTIFSGLPMAEPRPSPRHFDRRIQQKTIAKNRTLDILTPVWLQSWVRSESTIQPVAILPQSAQMNTGPARSQLFPKPAFIARARRLISWTAVKRRPVNANYTKLQLVLISMAGLLFVTGLVISLQALRTNHAAAAQAATLARRGNNAPSTDKPSSVAVSNYFVAPDLPRYITIPKLGVNARVLQVGVNKDGSLGTPSNVYDTAWYTGSSKPGQPGATLIDGHVSSWTTHGVFYGLKKLVAGDKIQIQRGDGQILTYQVVKSQIYPDNHVDMQAAMTPVVAGKSGLNLITCTGQVKKGTSEFNQRIIVFAEQV